MCETESVQRVISLAGLTFMPWLPEFKSIQVDKSPDAAGGHVPLTVKGSPASSCGTLDLHLTQVDVLRVTCYMRFSLEDPPFGFCCRIPANNKVRRDCQGSISILRPAYVSS